MLYFTFSTQNWHSLTLSAVRTIKIIQEPYLYFTWVV